MIDVPIEQLDAEIARAEAALRGARRDLAIDPEGVYPPLWDERRVSTRTTVQELAERPGDPILRAARAWVEELTLARVLWPDEVRSARAWHAETVEQEDLDPQRSSPRYALARIVGETSAARRHAWAQALRRGSGTAADAARKLAERRAEAARLLGRIEADASELPCDPPGAIGDAATMLLARTEGLVPRAGHWDDAVAQAMARDAGRGWPAHLTGRWLLGLFAPTGLFDGLAITPHRLPKPIGAASFMRALTTLGAAYAEADVPLSAPFVLARSPYDLRCARRAALFGSLAFDPIFAMRVLDLGRDAAREQTRVVARGALISVRLLAAKVGLRGALIAGPKERADRFEASTAGALGAPIPVELAGLVPRLQSGDAASFAGVLLAAADRRALVQRSDEDWFRSPHAAQLLREEQGRLSESPRTTRPALESGLETFIEEMSAILG